MTGLASVLAPTAVVLVVCLWLWWRKSTATGHAACPSRSVTHAKMGAGAYDTYRGAETGHGGSGAERRLGKGEMGFQGTNAQG